MSTTIYDLITDANSSVSAKYGEKYVTEGINRLQHGNTPRGIYRGFRVTTSATPGNVKITADPLFGDHAAVYSDGNFSLTIRRDGGDIEVSVGAYAGNTIWIVIRALYEVPTTTLPTTTEAELVIYTNAEYLASPDIDYLVVLAKVVVPGGGTVAKSNIYTTFRTEPWFEQSLGVRQWKQIVQSPNLDTVPVDTSTMAAATRYYYEPPAGSQPFVNWGFQKPNSASATIGGKTVNTGLVPGAFAAFQLYAFSAAVSSISEFGGFDLGDMYIQGPAGTRVRVEVWIKEHVAATANANVVMKATALSLSGTPVAFDTPTTSALGTVGSWVLHKFEVEIPSGAFGLSGVAVGIDNTAWAAVASPGDPVISFGPFRVYVEMGDDVRVEGPPSRTSVLGLIPKRNVTSNPTAYGWGLSGGVGTTSRQPTLRAFESSSKDELHWDPSALSKMWLHIKGEVSANPLSFYANSPYEVTLSSSGQLTPVNSGLLQVKAYSGSSDNVEEIVITGTEGDGIYLVAAYSGHTITFIPATNVLCPYNKPVVMSGANKVLMIGRRVFPLFGATAVALEHAAFGSSPPATGTLRLSASDSVHVEHPSAGDLEIVALDTSVPTEERWKLGSHSNFATDLLSDEEIGLLTGPSSGWLISGSVLSPVASGSVGGATARPNVYPNILDPAFLTSDLSTVVISSSQANLSGGGFLISLSAETGTADTLFSFAGLPISGVKHALFLLQATAGHTITVQNGTYIVCPGGVDFTLSSSFPVLAVAKYVAGNTYAYILAEPGFSSANAVMSSANIALATLGSLALGPYTTATISAGIVAVTSSRMRLDTEVGAASDNLDQLTGGYAGQLLVISTTSDSRDIVCVHSSYIRTTTGANVTLASADSRALLVCRSPGLWSMIGLSS